MQSPTGSVVALSSAASTVFSIGMVFLAYWGLHESTKWRPIDVVVATLAIGGFVCLGSVPWFATKPSHEPDEASALRIARHAFLAGVSGVWLAIVVSLFG
jgi:RsiW-degrading membrane proteinase PrsW (M82 family)